MSNMDLSAKLSAQLGGNKKDSTQKQQSSSAPYMSDMYQLNRGNLIVRTIANDYSSGGETLEKIYDVAEKAVEIINKDMPWADYSVHKVIKDDFGNNYSSLVIANTLRNKDGSKVSIFHTLLIEATGEYPSPYIYQTGMGSIAINRTPASAVDKKFMASARQQIRLDLRDPELKAVTVDAMIIPQGFDSSDESAIRRIVNNSINAVYSKVLEMVEGKVGSPLSNFTSDPNAKFTLSVRFANDSQMGQDAVGLPFRRDVATRLSTKIGSNNQNSVNSGDTGENVFDMYGYIDFEYQARAMYQNAYGQPQNTQCFMPRYVMTMAEGGPRTLVTPSVIAMMLVSTIAVSEQQKWAQGFIESSSTSNIGLLNILANLNNNETGIDKPVNTKDKSMGPTGIYNFIRSVTFPSLLISLDVPEAGGSTWYLSSLARAARNDATEIARINQAINELTGGGWDPKVPMFINITNKYHGGFYVEKGERYDLRRVSSFLGYAKLITDRNLSPSLLLEYVKTTQAVNIPADIRAQNRLDLLREAGIEPVVTQMYDRLTINSEWLTQLTAHCAKAGFSPMTDTYGYNNDMFQTSGFDFSHAGVAPDVRITGTVDQWGGYNNNYNDYSRGF